MFPAAVNSLVEPDNHSSIVESLRDDQVDGVESQGVQGRCTVDTSRCVEIKQFAVVRRTWRGAVLGFPVGVAPTCQGRQHALLPSFPKKLFEI